MGRLGDGMEIHQGHRFSSGNKTARKRLTLDLLFVVPVKPAIARPGYP